MESVNPVVSVKPVTTACKCQREVALDPAGRPIPCRNNAALLIAGVALCREHAAERMLAAEAAYKRPAT